MQELFGVTVTVFTIALVAGRFWKSRWETAQDQRAADRASERLDWTVDRFDGTYLTQPEEYERPTGMIPYLIQHPIVLALSVGLLILVMGRLLLFMRAMEAEARSRPR